MDGVIVFVYYDGEWIEPCNYSGYSVCGVKVPVECSFQNFISLVATQINKDPEKHQFAVQYQTMKLGPRIHITNDYSLSFYLDLKKDEIDKRNYPLCVDVYAKDSVVAADRYLHQHQSDIDASNSISMSLNSRGSNEHFSLPLIDSIQTVEEMGKELAGYINDISDDHPAGYSVVTRPHADEVAVGKVFVDKEVLVTTVGLYAIKKQFEYYVAKSDTKTYTIKCLEKCCNWTLRASITCVSGNFRIRKMDDIHTCSLDKVLGDHRQASTLVIASCVKYRFQSSRRIYTPRDIIDDIQETYGVTISYDKAWRSRERAIMMIRGNLEESYGNLPSYMHMVEVANPGSYTRIETDNENRFRFSFVALGASIAGWRHCKPIIVVDGTFLTSRYQGTLFTACTQDANNNIFILAFGVGDAENNNAWEWFLLRLREAYGVRDDLCIVSDRHGSIEHAVDKVFPDAMHGACTYHLLKNIKKHYGKNAKGVRIPFNAAARAYTKAEFETHMRRIDEIDKGIRGYLEKVGFEKWSRSYMTKDRYSTMTSNIVESVNSSIKHAKKYPIEAMFECLRCTIQKWFFKNLSNAKSTFTHLADRHNAMLNERVKMSKQIRVHPSSDVVYQVNDGITQYVVNLEDKSCSCRRFQLDHLPCPHAIAVISKQNNSLIDYCSTFFTKEKYLDTYSSTVFPLGDKNEWFIPDSVRQIIVLPPISKRGPGRPKEARLKSSIEKKKTSRCGKCGSYGHNCRSCSDLVEMNERNGQKRKKSGRIVNKVVAARE